MPSLNPTKWKNFAYAHQDIPLLEPCLRPLANPRSSSRCL